MSVKTESGNPMGWIALLNIGRWSPASRRTLAGAMVSAAIVSVFWVADIPDASLHKLILIPLALLLFTSYEVSCQALVRLQQASTDGDVTERMAGMMVEAAHDLRTPVMALQAFTQLLIENKASLETQREWLEVIRSESLRLGQTLDDILDLNRLHSQGPRINCADHQLRRIVEEVVRPFVTTGSHAFRIEWNAAPAYVHADGSKLMRALGNLVANAVKYSPQGTTIVLQFASDQGGVTFEVADQGPGVVKDEGELIFEPFVRGAAASCANPGPPGAGLGLAIVRAVARLHGGEVTVRNQADGYGAVFALRIGDTPGCPHQEEHHGRSR